MRRIFSKNLLMNYLAFYHIEKISIYQYGRGYIVWAFTEIISYEMN